MPCDRWILFDLTMIVRTTPALIQSRVRRARPASPLEYPLRGPIRRDSSGEAGSVTPFQSLAGERQQLAAGRADLDVGAHGGADAAVEAGRPPAVVLLELGERVLPVVPQPLLVEARVEVIPGQYLVGVAFPRRVPVEIDAVQRGLGRADPTLEREVLAPAVESPTVAPYLLDHGADATIAAREQALDEGRLAVVVPHADVATERAIRIDGGAQLRQPAVHCGRTGLRRPLERRVRLGHESADRHGASDVATTGRLASGADHVVGHVGDLEDVLVGLGRQSAHEVQLHLTPPVRVRGGERADQVVLGGDLVDHPAEALRATFGREREPG